MRDVREERERERERIIRESKRTVKVCRCGVDNSIWDGDTRGFSAQVSGTRPNKGLSSVQGHDI